MFFYCTGCGLAAKIWSGGESAEQCLLNEELYKKTILYCASDVEALENLWEYLQKHGLLKRKTKAGHVQTWIPFCEKRIRNVGECLKAHRLCEVNTSWMTTPGPTPETCLEWISDLKQKGKLE